MVIHHRLTRDAMIAAREKHERCHTGQAHDLASRSVVKPASANATTLATVSVYARSSGESYFV